MRGFTVVELLIVIVIIGILAALTIISYGGVQVQARDSAMSANVTQAYKQARTQYVRTGSFPSAIALQDGTSYQISSDNTTGDLCVTGVKSGYPTKSFGRDSQLQSAPCDGHTGGPDYCPEISYVAINGYFCNGSVGSTPTEWTGVTKLLASDVSVPAGAPGYYVSRQGTRDAYGSAVFPAVPGDTFCVSGWVTTTSSTVLHRLGIQFIRTSGNAWTGGNGLAPAATLGVWTKYEACATAPSETYQARLWTQNDGSNGSTADAYWYQTALRMVKQ